MNISVQPISNTNGSGIGAGYRMLPDGQQFAKPVTMTFAYTDEEIERTLPGALGISYQNSKGIWMSVGGVALDTTAKKVSVNVGHFTDFTLFQYVYLDPEYSAIDPGQSTTITVFGLGTISWAADDLPEGKEVALPRPAPVEYIDSWELNGEGTLQGTGKKVTYKAPAQMPNANPALIILKLKSPGKTVGYLISRVFVAKEGLSLQVGGGDWIQFPMAQTHLAGAVKGIDGLNGAQTISIFWQGGAGPRNALGLFPWTPETVGVAYRQNASTKYLHLYGTRPDVSEGTLKVQELRYGILMGSFDIPSAGVYVTSNPPVIYTSTMRGVFRVKCADCAK